MKRIGICTLYYKNRNYGGNLQSYALVTLVNGSGYYAEMISYYNSGRVKYFLAKIKEKLIKKDEIYDRIKLRNKAIDSFNLKLPHSTLYFRNTIDKANDSYDVFIVGSDQVWNPQWINRFTSLAFCDESKRTIAYAASVGKTQLDDREKVLLKQAMDNTQVISIREKDSIPALMELTNKEIQYVLDPTMLLTREEWDSVCSPRIVSDNYIFCYYLKDNDHLRRIAEQFANRKGYRIVSLPFLNGSYREVDNEFGDYQMYDISPYDFLSLVKYASFVITDSFHAAVFSHLYERQFVATGYNNTESGCRMKSLTELFGTGNRFFDNPDSLNIESIMSLAGSPIVIEWDEYYIMKNQSLRFLMEELSSNDK